MDAEGRRGTATTCTRGTAATHRLNLLGGEHGSSTCCLSVGTNLPLLAHKEQREVLVLTQLEQTAGATSNPAGSRSDCRDVGMQIRTGSGTDGAFALATRLAQVYEWLDPTNLNGNNTQLGI